MHRLGIDLGGTKIEGVILDAQGQILFRERVPTESEKGYHAIISNIKKLYETMTARISGAAHTLGIGTPGAISLSTGLLKNSNTVCMNQKPVKDDLEKSLGRKVALQNDANCFAMAEALRGAGQGKDLVFGVILGTGCGGGIVYKGEVWTGKQAIAGEWGHMILNPQGPKCYCGKYGCVETLISGGGLERLYQQNHADKKSLPEIIEAFRAGNEPAVKFMRQFFTHFGMALSNVINILDPDIVVLGGGLSNIDELYSEGMGQIEKYVFTDVFTTPVVKHSLGDSAGVIGAALIGI